MHQPTDYTRSRIVVAAMGALLVIAAGHHTPTIAQISVSIDDHMMPQVDADWSPAVALAIDTARRAAMLIGTIRLR